MDEMSHVDAAEVGGSVEGLVPDGIDELRREAGGRWLVQTVGSLHVFDLDHSSYVRHRGQSRRGFDHDGRQMRLTRVERWPRVGGSFFIWLDDPDVPDLVEHWRQSSTVVSIKPLGPTESPRPPD